MTHGREVWGGGIVRGREFSDSFLCTDPGVGVTENFDVFLPTIWLGNVLRCRGGLEGPLIEKEKSAEWRQGSLLAAHFQAICMRNRHAQPARARTMEQPARGLAAWRRAGSRAGSVKENDLTGGNGENGG
jgi:hypothetical protein